MTLLNNTYVGLAAETKREGYLQENEDRCDSPNYINDKGVEVTEMLTRLSEKEGHEK